MDRKRLERTSGDQPADPGVGSIVIGTSDASEESRAGASTAVALVMGAYIRGQWQRGREEQRGADPG